MVVASWTRGVETNMRMMTTTRMSNGVVEKPSPCHPTRHHYHRHHRHHWYPFDTPQRLLLLLLLLRVVWARYRRQQQWHHHVIRLLPTFGKWIVVVLVVVAGHHVRCYKSGGPHTHHPYRRPFLICGMILKYLCVNGRKYFYCTCDTFCWLSSPRSWWHSFYFTWPVRGSDGHYSLFYLSLTKTLSHRW